MRWKVDIFVICFKLVYLFSFNKQITIITIVTQNKAKFCLSLLKLILNFFSAAPVLPLVSSVDLSPNTKKVFLRLSVWDDELLSTLKLMTFLAKSLPELHQCKTSNAIPKPLYTYLLSSKFFAMLVAPEKQCKIVQQNFWPVI